MTHSELATAIRERFTPLVFACDCKGADADCAEILARPAVWTP